MCCHGNGLTGDAHSLTELLFSGKAVLLLRVVQRLEALISFVYRSNSAMTFHPHLIICMVLNTVDQNARTIFYLHFGI